MKPLHQSLRSLIISITIQDGWKVANGPPPPPLSFYTLAHIFIMRMTMYFSGRGYFSSVMNTLNFYPEGEVEASPPKVLKIRIVWHNFESHRWTIKTNRQNKFVYHTFIKMVALCILHISTFCFSIYFYDSINEYFNNQGYVCSLRNFRNVIQGGEYINVPQK